MTPNLPRRSFSISTLLLPCLIFSFACSSPPDPQESRPSGPDPRDCAVYSAFLSEYDHIGPATPPNVASARTPYVVEDRTASLGLLVQKAHVQSHFRELPASTIDSLFSLNRVPVTLPQGCLTVPIHLISADERTRLERSPPSTLALEYSGASSIVRLSLPAYSPNGIEAILYYDYWCGLLCGAGSMVQMEYINGRWRITKELNLWIS
jgi:hypothetical protein